MTEQTCVIIGAPDRGQGLEGYAKGTRSITCEDCGGATYFAPSSLNRPEASSARFICTDCAKRRQAEATDPPEIGPLTDEQRREFVERGIDPDLIQRLLDERGAQGVLDLSDTDLLIDMACRENRPSDRELEALASTWRLGIAKCGPSIDLPLPALAILTLISELIELRAKVRS